MLNIHAPRSEKIWLTIGGVTLIVFLLLCGIMAFKMGLNPAGDMRTINADLVDQTPPFNQTGLFSVGEKEYRATMVVRAFAFQPNQMTIPVGSTVHFETTSPDVVHDMFITGTTVNMTVVPGHITSYSYTFKKPGDYLILCNEYCGLGHHLMMGKITVQ